MIAAATFTMSTPATAQLLRGNGNGAYNGWPQLPKLEALRDAFLASEDKVAQIALAREIQAQALSDVPYLPLGSYFQPTAFKTDLHGMQKGLIQFTGVRRG